MSKKKCFVDEVMNYRKHSIDIAMLDRFTAYCRKRLVDYARIFHAIWRDSHIRDNPESRHAREKDIDKVARTLKPFWDNEYQLNREEYTAVGYFLGTLRGELGLGLIKFNLQSQIQCSNAHEAVLTVASDAAHHWCQLSKQYRSSHISISYKFTTTLGVLLPHPVKLYALLAAEYAKAREILLAQPESLQ